MSTASPHPYCIGTDAARPSYFLKPIDIGFISDMCKSSSATEETSSGGYKVDSVVLRIMTQQDNCICRVTLENQIKPISIGLRKYDGLAASVPMQYGCGLAVDINHIPDMSTGNVIAPIKCMPIWKCPCINL
jgi:hypothetical protein